MVADKNDSLHLIGLGGSGESYVLRKLVLGEKLKSLLTPAPQEFSNRPKQILVIVPDNTTMERTANDIEFLLRGASISESRSESNPSARAGEGSTSVFQKISVNMFPGWDVLPFDAISPSPEIVAARMLSLADLLEGSPGVTIATAETLIGTLPPAERIRRSILNLTRGQFLEREELVTKLDSLGYVHASVVEELGQIAVRGAVLDIFAPGYSHPCRIELFGDRVEEIRFFDAGSQRSIASERKSTVTKLRIVPVTELLFSYHEDAEPHATRSLWAMGARNRLRSRATDLEIPLRTLEPIEEALQNGGTWPGLEHLVPIVDGSLASLWDYLPSETLVFTIDEISILQNCENARELVLEREQLAKNELRVFPVPRSAYRLDSNTQQELNEKSSVYSDQLRILSFDADAQSVEELNPLSSFEEGSRVAVGDQTKLKQSLQRTKHDDLPLKPLADSIQKDLTLGMRVGIAVSHSNRIKRFQELFRTYAISAEPADVSVDEWFKDSKNTSRVTLFDGNLSNGLRSEVDRFSLIADHDVFPELSGRKPARSVSSVRRFLGSVSQIKEGDFIVHIDHGVAKYLGLRELSVEEKTGDFMHLEYADGAKLFVPVENIGKIQKYVGAEGKAPALSKLGGKNWTAAKEKVKQQIQELAGQLLNLYADRELVEGYSFGPKDSDDSEFAETFPYQETVDQLKAIDDVFSDMEKPRPMDRLVCGDVGFGKTEVAIRAAFKAVNKGKQVAFLVPTTILADQHYATFRERFKDFPVTVGCVSRFYTANENRKTLEDAALGKMQIVIGTHRLLQKDVYFKDLGLLIIDEEHKFGVADKERLKRMRREVHVLTLTATPIPRTLYMSLFDIRDLSVIETPPTDRQVIRTYVAPYQASVVREAILRELGRQGQVFVIHNRVGNIAMVADEIRELVPEARVEFAHGQMKENQLESVMHKFVSHEMDVLVSTTIVESGLDIPNANTIIIRDADRLGLAELYQLRGRVGRSSRRASAYLLISDTKVLGPDAKKRLQVLQSLDDLGQGFRLALQDMEIRGAGNLLGKDQSGKIELVGFELYSRILKEAIRELRARAKNTPESLRQALELSIDPEVSIGFPAHIPTFYIPDVEERLLMYQRLVDIRSAAEASDMSEEITDRFGAMPTEVVTLLEVMVFRSVLRRAGIVAAAYRRDLLSLTFHREARVDIERLMMKVHGSLGKIKFSPSMVLTSRITGIEVTTPSVLTEYVTRFLKSIGCNVAQNELGELQ